MLQIKNIKKQYKTGELVQKALDGVSLNLRDNEFVAILGPSGSGKTTLLNMIGGLDRYDSGDLIINSISTKNYKDRDWDSYRNHTIGFVFQNYNLIQHQSILANVELALTISGISRKERKNRAKLALEEVGLGDQLHKKPNQMSGGQMQRVAIARALVNNPDILLADEPTGALDSETSLQVMELLKEVAHKRLVVMVTHNPELAESYATRIVRLMDGKIIDDSDPFQPDENVLEEPTYKNMGKSSMSFLTSLSLSFNNLRTKKGRTILTSFAGSIGIIGISLILSLSTGVNSYIENLQKDTMNSYPITIETQSLDISSLMSTGRESSNNDEETDHALDGVYSDGSGIELASSASMSITTNNLTEFKKYLDDTDSEIWQYIGQNGVIYSYDTKFSIYSHDPEGRIVNADGSTLEYSNSSILSGSTGMMSMMNTSTGGSYTDQLTGTGSTNNNLQQLMPGTDGDLISSTVTDSYDVLYGTWPEEYDEIVLVLDEHNEIPAAALYQLGLLPSSEYEELIEKILNDEEVALDTQEWSYEEICEHIFYMIPASDLYTQKESGIYQRLEGTDDELEALMAEAVQLKIVGIIRPSADSDNASISGIIGYTSALTDYIIDYSNNSPIVLDQQESETINLLTGAEFSPEDDAAKVQAAKDYIDNLTVEEKAALYRELMQQLYRENPSALQMMQDLTEKELAAALDDYVQSAEDEEEESLLAIYDSYVSAGTYEDNLEAFGYVSLNAPSRIDIYADSFEAKESITACIEDYNKAANEENQISHTDYIGLLMSSVTSIVNVVSYVLIAFVAVSLLVSSIMIGIITYISVLERTKEIGILRAIGASKRNISQVFNAETFIIGACSGLLGVGITMLLLIPGNAAIHSAVGTTDVNAVLSVPNAAVLVILSMILTVISGLIPAKKAAKKDPVTALRAD